MEEIYKINRIDYLEEKRKTKKTEAILISVSSGLGGILAGGLSVCAIIDRNIINGLYSVLFATVSGIGTKEVYDLAKEIGQIDQELKTLKG